MPASPYQLYKSHLEDGSIDPDPGQGAVIEALDQLAKDVPRCLRKSLPFLKTGDHAGGLYIYGPVGRGKTMLMDLFFGGVEEARKRRVHFHEFMLEVHGRLHGMREKGAGNPLDQVAKAILKEARLLCFDEFQVYNIADAMILGRLFRSLFRGGAIVVATSNMPPEELYKDGLQRALFLPFIDMIKKRLTVLSIGEGVDHRLARLKGLPVYITPLDQSAHDLLAAIFFKLTDVHEPRSKELTVMGRKLFVPRKARQVAWFTYDELCRAPLAPSDYLALCENYHTLILENVPALKDSDGERDAALRFIHLIDIMYEKHANIVLSAAKPLEMLIEKGSTLAPRFERTQSRLYEMQSEDYMNMPHRLAKAAS